VEHQNSFGRLTKRKILMTIGGVIALACAVIAFIILTQPERSVASFCRVAKEEKPVLVGDVNYEKRLGSYKKLEAVSPDDILSDITTIRKGYESIVQNPSNTVSAGLGIAGAENRRTDYINKNCPDF
jgi:hypothetical protein